jgi:hypothetical protein
MTRAKGVRCGKLEREPSLADLVVQQYEEGASLALLARRHGLGHEPLRSKLIERGVKIRTPTGIWALRPTRERSGTLSAEEVARLRAAVGLTDPVIFEDDD